MRRIKYIIPSLISATLILSMGITASARTIHHTKEEMFSLYGKPVIDYTIATSTGVGPGEAFDKNKAYDPELFKNGFSLLCSDTENNFEPWKNIRFETASNGVLLKTYPDSSDATYWVPLYEGRGKDRYPDSPYSQAYYELQFRQFGEKPPVAFTSKLSAQVPLTSIKRTNWVSNGPATTLFNGEYLQKYNNQTAHYYLTDQIGGMINFNPSIDLEEGCRTGTLGWHMDFRDSKHRSRSFTKHMYGADKLSSDGTEDIPDREQYKIPACWAIRLPNADAVWFEMSMTDWDMIYQCLREVSPDAEEIFDAIYKDYYEGSLPFVEFDKWYPIGKDSHIMQLDFTDRYAVYYYFY